jgi:molecular chaperone GrpE
MPDDGDVRDEAAETTNTTADEHGHEPQHRADAASDEQQQPDESPVANGTDDWNNESDPQAALEQLETELGELREQLLRKSADFDNYRKRMLREREELISFSNRELLLDILPIIDDFERAMRSAEDSRDFDAFHDGIVMIEKQFTSMLERKWKLKRFDSVGEEFDPQRHEAMMTEPVPGHDRSIVLEDFQKGYTLASRVLRPAKVKVSMPSPASEGGKVLNDDAPAAENTSSQQ